MHAFPATLPVWLLVAACSTSSDPAEVAADPDASCLALTQDMHREVVLAQRETDSRVGGVTTSGVAVERGG
jgi:hypothetical protein